MSNLTDAGRDLSKALTAVSKALELYYEMALAEGRSAPEGPTARGLSASQLRSKLQAYVIARLSPKPHPLHKSVLQFEGAPQARRHVANHSLPGLPA